MTSNPLADLLTRLQAALVAESAQVDRTPVIVAALTLDVLKNFWGMRPEANVSFEAFGGSGSAVVQRGPAGAVLWMDPNPDGYRATFERFAAKYWGLGVSLTKSGYDVDHVYNRARARQYGYRLVRMFLVEKDANQAHGRSYEKQIGAAEKNRFVKIMKLLDGMSELKVLGLPPVRHGLLLPEHYEAAKQASAQYGISLADALETLRSLCTRAES